MFKEKVFFVFLSTGTKIQKMSLTKPSKMETTDVLNQLVGQYSSDSDDEKVGEKRTGIIS